MQNNSDIIQEKGNLEFERFLIPYMIFGDKKQSLILLNGAQQSMGVWRSFIPHFIDLYQIITFDFPGQGKAGIQYPLYSCRNDAMEINESM